MNTFVLSIVVAAASALFVTLTRPKQQQEYFTIESNMALFLRVAIITFVCSYFGLTYLLAPSCPDIIQGEPDF